jgi:hypothetical protein
MNHKQRVTRGVYVVFVVLITLFVISSITQIARKVFGGPDAAEAQSARFPKVGTECGEALKEAMGAIETTRLAASTENGADAAKARYVSERRVHRRTDLDGRCGADPHGTEALAALARLDRAAESNAVREARELSPVRLAAQSFISGPTR